MTSAQIAILLLLAAMLVLFAVERIRMEIVALGGLAIGVLFGLVPASAAFSGLANPAFVTGLEVLVIVQVLGRTGIAEKLAAWLPRSGFDMRGQTAILCALTALISLFVNNIGALAIMIPAAAAVGRAEGADPRAVYMPIGFAGLLGGLCSIIGTPANLIVSRQLQSAEGQGFTFFDFAWVGLPVTLVGLIVICTWTFGALSRGGPADRQTVRPSRVIVTEMSVPGGSALVGTAVGELDADIHGLWRAGQRAMWQRPGTLLWPGDRLLASVDTAQLDRWAAEGAVEWQGAGGRPLMEAVVMPESPIVGSRIATLGALAMRKVNVVALASRSPRIEGGLADIQLAIGDVLLLEGDPTSVAEALEEAELVSLGATPALAPRHDLRLVAGIFAAGVAAAAGGLLDPQLAFGLVVLGFAACGTLNLREALAQVDWPILIMLAAMIPLGEAVGTSGAAATIAHGMNAFLPAAFPILPVLGMLVLAVLVTPFVNNATTAIILGPIAVDMAHSASLHPAPYLIAVALGASIDFLTPIGHHNNTVVMGIAGYRFVDFLRAGWPLTLVTLAVGTGALWLFWS